MRREQRGPQIFLSRTHPQFMAKLFAQEVPEIYDGIIEVKSVARDPGSRAEDRRHLARLLDRSGRRLRRHARLAASRRWSNELQGEKIDIIPWSPGPGDASSSTRCSRPKWPRSSSTRTPSASRSSCRTEQLSLAIGRRGQNVRLASQLTGWDIDILTEAGGDRSAARRSSPSAPTLPSYTALDVDEVVGQLLASEGFASLEEIAFVELEELASIEGFDEETASELQQRARDYLDRIEAEHDEERKTLGVADELKELEGMTSSMLVALGKDGIKTMEDFAGCAGRSRRLEPSATRARPSAMADCSTGSG